MFESVKKFILNIKSNRVLGAVLKNDLSVGNLFSGRGSNVDDQMKTIKQVMWVYKCVSIIAETIANLEWNIYDANKKKVENTKGLTELLNRPNNYQDGYLFKEGLVYYLLLTGNNFIAKEGMTKGAIKELYLINPSPLTINGNKDGITEYIYKVIGIDPISYRPEEICHTKLFNPFHPFYGMGKIEYAESTYEAEYKAVQYNNKFFENGAKPSSVLSTDQTLEDKSFDRLSKQFEAKHGGLKNMHKNLVLDQGMKFTQMGLTQKDMDFILQRKMNREEILSIFGVPPAKAGILETANYSNAKEQNYTFQSETISPLANRIASSLTLGIVRVFNPGWTLKFENIIQRDKTEDSTIAGKYFGMGALTPNEIRVEYLGKEALDEEALDQAYLPISVIPASDSGITIAEPVQTPAPVPPETKPEDKSAKSCDCHSDDLNVQGKAISPRQVIYRESVMLRKRIGKTAKKIMVKFFTEQKARVIDRLKGKGLNGLDTKDLAGDIFNSAFEDAELQKFAKRYHTSMISVTIDALNDILELDVDSTTQNPAVNISISKLARKVTRINDTTKDAIDKVIRQGIEAGSSIDQIAEGIQSVYGQATSYRAQLIARYETSAAWDSAAVNSYKEYGSKFVDVIGCEGTDDYPATNCNRTNIPIAEAEGLEFHPNHTGCLVPQL